jgi:hypothetical protein
MREAGYIRWIAEAAHMDAESCRRHLQSSRLDGGVSFLRRRRFATLILLLLIRALLFSFAAPFRKVVIT